MSLKISKLKLSGIRQFIDVTFDFTDPETGKPLDRVCLIGGNGTGKSTLLRLLAVDLLKTLEVPHLTFNNHNQVPSDGAFAVELTGDEDSFVFGNRKGMLGWSETLDSFLDDSYPRPLHSGDPNLGKWESWRLRVHKLLSIYCPPDSDLTPSWVTIHDVPATNLDAALRLLRNPTVKFKIGQDNVSGFWELLIALVKHREAKLLEYSQEPRNQERTVREVKEEFLAQNPDILSELTDLWRPILSRAGLKFDYEKASIPVQLTDNLRAYISLMANDALIPYADLSTGIRSFLFRLGHLFTIFRFHAGKGGIVLIDEPENSLYPDFLFDLIGHYEKAAPGAQMFFATHSPIVAAQFKPEERFILEFDPDRGVVVRRGVTPEGDDPKRRFTQRLRRKNALRRERHRKLESLQGTGSNHSGRDRSAAKKSTSKGVSGTRSHLQLRSAQ